MMIDLLFKREVFIYVYLYCSNGEEKWTYNERTKEKLIEFMKNPVEPPPPPAPEAPWSETESSVVHLTSDDFFSTLKRKKHALIMFYAPCKFPPINKIYCAVAVLYNLLIYSLII